jgi:two-component system sensor histidine kinase/response regulator
VNRNLLYVDDQRENHVVFRAAFGEHFNILEASSAREALDLFDAHEIPVMVADQRMPDVTGVELCVAVRRYFPQTIRMILTGYTDSDAMMAAINEGQVYSFITKPWERETLFSVLVRGFEAYDLVMSNTALSERLTQAERCAALGRCAAGIAHEMRNQLFILPLVELIENKYREHAELVELARIARLTQGRLEELIDEVKNFVRKDTEDCRKIPTNLGQLTREAVSLAGMHESIPKRSLKLMVQAEPVVHCNKAKIQQMIFNLLENAAEAVKPHENPEIRVTVAQDGSAASLSVQDNGSGIAPAHLEKIWEPFFTTKDSKGTGLGLDMCRRTVEAHGGTIACDSRLGEGSTFVVRLPLAEDSQAT